jgi:hypothetical protein
MPRIVRIATSSLATLEAIIAEFGLAEFDTFIGRCTEAQQAARSSLTQEAAQARGSAPLPGN